VILANVDANLADAEFVVTLRGGQITLTVNDFMI
jgi:hypothetical protein